MRRLVLALPGNERLADGLARQLPAGRCPVTSRRFPDGESYVRIDGDVTGCEVLVACTLDRPDEKLVPLFLLADAARENGALRVGLLAPYLPYMRQDQRFAAGEVASARHVARWISGQFDWLVTVDPHLHRIKDLGEVYSIAYRTVHAAGEVAEWIRANVTRPLLVGPDEESAQWVTDVVSRIDAPHVVLDKVRRGDREVSVSVPQLQQWTDCTPVLVDDIVSTARTMIETVRTVRSCGLGDPVCIAVHPIFAAGALQQLREAGAARIVSADTVTHESNGISLVKALAQAVNDLH